MTNNQKMLNEHETRIDEKIAEYNKAIEDGVSINDLAKLEEEIKDAEVDYAEAKRTEVFEICKNSPKPIFTAIEMHHYEVFGHKTTKDEEVITGVEKVSKTKQIDLVKLCKYCGLDTAWQYMVEKFNQLLAARTAKELGLTEAQIRKLKDSFAMNKIARDLEMGETPDSNTKMCKMLQTILNGFMFEAGENGENIYKVNSHDVKYLVACYTKRGKKFLSVSVAKSEYIHRLVADIAHRVLMGKAYDLEYKMTEVSENAAVEVKPETAKAEKPKKSAKKTAETAKA